MDPSSGLINAKKKGKKINHSKQNGTALSHNWAAPFKENLRMGRGGQVRAAGTNKKNLWFMTPELIKTR